MTATLVQPSPSPEPHAPQTAYTTDLTDIRRGDLARVGGKGANLGEMTSVGLPIPPGFVITTEACMEFLGQNRLNPRIADELRNLDPDDNAALSRASANLTRILLDGIVPDAVRLEIEQRYDALLSTCDRVAVRSSATAEDSPQFSFAGMFETFLNVAGKAALLDAVKRCWASAFGARVLFYRLKQGLPGEMLVGVVVQAMIDSDKSGVMFTADPASHDESRILIEAAWGLGEPVVQGAVTPDRHVLDKNSLDLVSSSIAEKEFLLEWNKDTNATERIDLKVDRRARAPVLTPAEITTLGELARRVEAHYGVPQDIEFAIREGSVILTQSRPITTLLPQAQEERSKSPGKPIVSGLGASPGVATGPVRVLASPAESAMMQTGEVLVTHMTSPDWVPIMRRAKAVVTDSGGMTSHAAIVARELGIPCIVGTRDSTRVLSTGTLVTVDGRAGTVVAGTAHAVAAQTSPGVAAATGTGISAQMTATRLYVNLAEPDRALEIAARNVDGVGLLRAEFMMIEALEHAHPREFLAKHTPDEFVQRMADSLLRFAKAFAPRPVIYRAMDFRTNEFRDLTGGAQHEPVEANPMIGYRGCLRYTREPDLFALELRALAEVRRYHGNIHLMIPFVRTARELEACLKLVDASPLGADAQMERWIMAEVPSVLFSLPRYAAMGITGVSIGSNDLTQLMLGVDRDSELFGDAYDERDSSVMEAIQTIIAQCRQLNLKCSICGQAPSVHPDYAEKLVGWGIDSISVTVDAIDSTRRNIARAESMILLNAARIGTLPAGSVLPVTDG